MKCGVFVAKGKERKGNRDGDGTGVDGNVVVEE